MRTFSCFLFLAACDTPSQARGTQPLLVQVESDPGVPLSGAHVWVDDDLLAEGDIGEFRATVASATNRVLLVRYDCPEGHIDAEAPTRLRVRPFHTVGSVASDPLQITLRCPPETHIASFVVRTTNAPPLPIRVNGVDIAHTGTTGVAFFSRRDPPDTEYLVQLDTSHDPRVTPRNPARVFALGNRHRIFVIDQQFEVARPRSKRERRPRITKIE